ncbi:MAG: LexA family protein [Bradyrhizobium sp.]|uniref:LexA family protein n=1 Tax=Bradyrhizobium sp. TaxID=376 RepID=UPI003D133333
MDQKDMTRQELIDWLKAGLKKAGKTQSGLAEHIGIPQSRISEMARGLREFKPEEIPPISEYLAEPPPDLNPVLQRGERVKISGKVQAGYWAEPDEEYEEARKWETIPFMPQYQGVRKFAVRVVGPSMNAIMPEGTLLVCAHLYDLQEEPISGKRYIVRMTRPDGYIENTVKELVIDSAGKPWLWPRSHHPEHQQPMSLDDREGYLVEIHARVIFAMIPEI